MAIAGAQQRTLQEKLGLLREMDLFAGLSDDDMYAIGHATTMTRCTAGQRIMSPDDPPDRIHILKAGKVRVYRVTPDGKQLTQSGIILNYLADKTSKFVPQGEDAKLEAWRWILFDNHKFTSFFAAHRFMRSFAPTPTDPAVLAMLKALDNVEDQRALVRIHQIQCPRHLPLRYTRNRFSQVRRNLPLLQQQTLHRIRMQRPKPHPLAARPYRGQQQLWILGDQNEHRWPKRFFECL